MLNFKAGNTTSHVCTVRDNFIGKRCSADHTHAYPAAVAYQTSISKWLLFEFQSVPLPLPGENTVGRYSG